ncbi:MAG: hypothetical protein ABI905_14405 [Betaproteobacteria bacterium]
MTSIRSILLVVGLFGAIIFTAAFVTSLLNPGYVEEVAKEIIRQRVETKTRETIHALDEKYLSGKAGNLVKSQAGDIAFIRRQLEENLPQTLATVIAQMRNLDCECRRKIETRIRDGLLGSIASAVHSQEKLTTLIRTHYMATAEKLTREFRIFTGTNALVFMLLALAAAWRRSADVQLLLPATLLVVAASVTAYLYLFRQNWLHTILFNDYVGLAYIGYMAVAFALLCDVLFNRARVITSLLNAFFNAIGSSFSLLPC